LSTKKGRPGHVDSSVIAISSHEREDGEDEEEETLMRDNLKLSYAAPSEDSSKDPYPHFDHQIHLQSHLPNDNPNSRWNWRHEEGVQVNKSCRDEQLDPISDDELQDINEDELEDISEDELEDV